MSQRIVSRGLLVAVLLTLLGLPVFHSNVLAQDEQPQARKVKTKIQPAYPELAKRMNLTGTVRIEVTITAAGALKGTRPVGGNPVLIEAAVGALEKWHWEPGPAETTEVIQFRFSL